MLNGLAAIEYTDRHSQYTNEKDGQYDGDKDEERHGL